MAFLAASNKKNASPICASLEASKLAVWQRQAAMVDSFRSTGLFPTHGLVFPAPSTPERSRQPSLKANHPWPGKRSTSKRKDTLRSR